MPYIKSQQVFQCPSDSNKTLPAWGSATSAAWPAFPVSYSVNGQIGASWALSTGSQTNWGAISIADVVKPAATVFMSDGGTQPVPNTSPLTWAEEHTGWVLEPWNGNIGSTNRGGPSSRHLESCNVGFMDGHVKSMSAENWYAINDTPWLKPSQGGI